jgi:hypothetical protein
MVDWIVTVFAVLAIFALIASLLALYVWRVDSHQFAVWRAVLRSPREGRRARRFGGLRSRVVNGPVPRDATTSPVTTSRESVAAQLHYWVEIEAENQREQ